MTSEFRAFCNSLFSLHVGYVLVFFSMFVVSIIMNVCVLQRDESILCNQREIQTLICSDVHKLIIDNPYQAKLISFQVCTIP